MTRHADWRTMEGLLGREPEAEHLLRAAVTEDPEFAAAR